ncbi:MAG: dynamin family protein [Capsulimonadaceae bacterium]
MLQDICEELKNATLDVLRKTAAAATLSDKALVARLGGVESHLSGVRLNVVVCGETNQGKSSLINALIDMPGVLPVHPFSPVTNTVCSFSHGAQESITAFTGEFGKEQATGITRTQMRAVVTEQGNQRNIRNVRLVSANLPLSKLRSGLALVDTPGISAINADHTALMYGCIPDADAVIYVSDIDRPYSKEDIVFLRERVLPFTENLLFAVTKIDLREEYQEIVQDNRRKLAGVLGLLEGEINIVPVSSQWKLDYLESGNPEDLRRSNFAAIEAQIWRLLKRSALGAIDRCLSESQGALHPVKLPVVSELGALLARSHEDQQRVERGLEAIRAQAQTLLGRSADWQTELTIGICDIQRRLKQSFQAVCSDIVIEMRRALGNAALVARPMQIANILEVKFDGAIHLLTPAIEQEAAALLHRVRTKCGVESQAQSLRQMVLQLEQAGVAPRSRPTGTGTGADLLRGAFALYGPGTTGGAMVPALAAANPVTARIAAAGIGFAVRRMETARALVHVSPRDRGEIARQIEHFVTECIADCETAIDECLYETEAAIVEDFRSQLRIHVEAATNAATAIQSAQWLCQESARGRIAALRARLVELDAIGSQAARTRQGLEIAARAVEQDGDNPPQPPAASPPQAPAVRQIIR